MTTIEWVKARRINKRTGKRETVWDLCIWAGSRKFTKTVQGYADCRRARSIWERIVDDIRAGRTRLKATLAILMLATLPSIGVNSPRPSSFHADNGRLVMVWTNLSEAHPWLLSYRNDLNQPWQWDATRLHATNRSLSVAVPMTNNQGFMRLWPAAPDQ